ncbi:hypothetical protein AX15_002482 [Amanita polypyramis BW_CC]|nr:hypothetical protein AX15_002482 [Amanita polypyramis BW_CC]
MQATMSIHAIHHPNTSHISRLSPTVSPVYTSYEHGFSIAEQFNSLPSEFQSNSASLRTSGTGPTLTGLGIECPNFSITQNLVDTTSEIGPKHNLYAPISIAELFHPISGSLLRRNYQPALFPKESKHASILDWCTSISSPVLSPCGQRDTLGGGFPESNTTLSFRALSAASGLSPDVLATHISATAEIALQFLCNSQPNTPYFDGNSKATNTDQHQPLCESKSHPWPLLFLPTPEMVPPIADINMREWFLANQEAIIGVDPADTFLPCSLVSVSPLLPQPESFQSPDSSFADVEDNDCDQDILSFDSGNEAPVRVVDDVHNETVPETATEEANFALLPETNGLGNTPLTEPVNDLPKGQDTCEDKDPSEYEPSIPGSQSDQDYLPVSPRPRSRRCVKRNELSLTQPGASSFSQAVPDAHSHFNQSRKSAIINLGTPVINAHFGITLTELQEKAERYRLRNNIPLSNTGEIEVEYDKRWLLSFVGKLSQQGELIHEFRCYVIGCVQTNKRRDHILIHLGGHLGQRPFKCTEWYVLDRLALNVVRFAGG